MNILKIIPGIKISLNQSQYLTYYSTSLVKEGSLVLIKIRKRKTIGLVIESKELKENKISLKKASFSLNRIEEVINPEEIFDQKLRDLMIWVSGYYLEPISLLFKRMLGRTSLKKWKQLKSRKILSEEKKPQKKERRFYLQIPQRKLFELIKTAFKKKEQFLIIYPEISKLDNFYQNIPEEFKKRTVIYHSELKGKELWQNWTRVFKEKSLLILSTRQGVFLPFRNLKTILIKEEASLSHKSWDSHPKINAKHVCLKLGEIHSAKVLIESIAPCLETLWNIEEKRYKRSDFLPQDSLRKIYLIDMKSKLERQSKNFSYLSDELIEKIKDVLIKKGKILILQNRRGLATYIFCQDCGYSFKCPFCCSSLAYHQNSKKLVCHWCGHKENPPKACPKCHGHLLKYAGHGTERVKQEIEEKIKDVNVRIIDNDICPTPKSKVKALKEFEQKGSVLITTSAILSLPLMRFDLTCFLNIDLLLNLPDFSAREKTLHLFRKISTYSKEIIIQTYSPEDEYLKMLIHRNYDKIYQQELSLRKKLHYPPYWQIVFLKYKHINEALAEKEAQRLVDELRKQIGKSKSIEVFGPIFPTKARLKNYHFRGIVIKVKKGELGQRNKILNIVPSKWDIDVDPIEF